MLDSIKAKGQPKAKALTGPKPPLRNPELYEDAIPAGEAASPPTISPT